MIKYLAHTELVDLYRETKNEEVYMEIYNRSLHVVDSLVEMFKEYECYMDVEAEIIFILNDLIVRKFNSRTRLSFNSHFKLCVIRKMSDYIDEIAKEKEIQETLSIISHKYETQTPLNKVIYDEFMNELINLCNSKLNTHSEEQSATEVSFINDLLIAL